MVWFFEMPFEFDNVPLASLQIISLTPPPPALYNRKYQGRSLLYPGYSFANYKRVSEHSYKTRRDAIHEMLVRGKTILLLPLKSVPCRSTLFALNRQVIPEKSFSDARHLFISHLCFKKRFPYVIIIPFTSVG